MTKEEEKAQEVWGAIIYRENFAKHQILREDLIIECAIKYSDQQNKALLKEVEDLRSYKNLAKTWVVDQKNEITNLKQQLKEKSEEVERLEEIIKEIVPKIETVKKESDWKDGKFRW